MFTRIALTLIAANFIFSCTAPEKTQTPSTTAPTAAAPVAAPLSARKDFAAKLARIQEGMPEEEALAILSKPDDIRSQFDEGKLDLSQIREYWYYGGDRNFAALATITIDYKHRVSHLAGTTGKIAALDQLSESQLRRHLELLAAASNFEVQYHNPQKTIAAVNALQPLGREVGLAVLHEFLNVNLESQFNLDEGFNFVIRTLLDDPSPPSELRLVDDIPLLGPHPLGVTSSSYLEKLEKENASWRAKPLTPPGDPLAVHAKLLKTLLPDDESTSVSCAQQLLRLIDTVYFAETDEQSIVKLRASIDGAKLNFAARKIKWDADLSCYTFADGKMLLPSDKPIYVPIVVVPKFSDTADNYKLTLTVRRYNSTRVVAEYRLAQSHGAAPTFFIHVYGTFNPDRALAEYAMTSSGSGAVSTGRILIDFSTEEKIRIDITHDKEKFSSELLAP